MPATRLLMHWSAAGALDVTLTAEEIKSLEEPYQPINVIGHY